MGDWAKKDDALIARLDRLLTTAPLTRKNFFGNTAWFLNSNDQMLLVAWGSNIALRLGEDQSSEQINSGHMRPFDPSGHRPKREYALILDQQSSDDDYVLKWIDTAIRYVGSLEHKKKTKKES